MKVDDSTSLPADIIGAQLPNEAPVLPQLNRIDQIDRQILALLAERADLTFDIVSNLRDDGKANFSPAKDQQRLRELQQHWNEFRSSKLPRLGLNHVFREIFSVCSSVNEPLRIAYLGPPGTFSHLAAIQAFGSSPLHVECSTIANVFDSVERGEADFGIVPIENSIEGGVTHTHDCLLKSNLLICSELVLDVRLCLAAVQNDLTQISRVYSHPQPLAQSRIWLATHLPRAQLVPSTSTTVAAQQAASDRESAAIVSTLGAELSGLQIIAQGIEDAPDNATRFVTIATQDATPTGHDKTSVVFSTPDERGALMQILSIFDSEGLNLSRIESRPDKARRWEYVFFTDIAGHRTEAGMQRALKRVQSQCQMVQILGSYPQIALPIRTVR
jgi:chorismate mutase/prephenate dehydratase